MTFPSRKNSEARPGSVRTPPNGSPDTASRPRVEVDASTSHRRCNPCRTPPRDGGAPRPLREDARSASLVGLVRALPERASERQQSGGGSSSCRPLHEGGPSGSSSLTEFEWPHQRRAFARRFLSRSRKKPKAHL